MHTKSPHVGSGEVPADCRFVRLTEQGINQIRGECPWPTTQKCFSTQTISVAAG